MRNTEFKTKEEYLAYRKQWKADYSQLTQEIRETKKEIRELQRNKNYAGTLQYHKLRLREYASLMIKELKTAKIEAQMQYLAAYGNCLPA